MKWRLAVWGLVLVVIMGLYAWRRGRAVDDVARASRDAEAVLAVDEVASEPVEGTLVEDFELTRENGETFDRDQLDGKVWVASFFFANCPGFCLTLNRSISDVVKEVADLDVQFVSFSVDPERDTPEVLQKYAEHFEADPAKWVFLTGEMDEIRRVSQESFKVSAERETHTNRLFLVGPDGRVQGYFRGTDPTEVRMLKRRIQEVLEEQS